SLGSAIAYCSADDKVLPEPLLSSRSPIRALYSAIARPYGSLGRTGWLQDGRPFSDLGRPIWPLQTRWFAGGHCTYFMPWNIEHTFEQIYQDISLNPQF